MASGTQRRTNERGAAMVEAAFITPVFFLLIFGIVEFGLLFRDSLTTNNAAHQGGRAASVGGADPDTDYLILRSVEHGMQAMGLQQLDYVVIWNASGPNDTMPVACETGSVNDTCNHYSAADFFKEIDDPVSGTDTGNWRCGVAAVDRYWCPSDRDTTLSGGTDYVGVYVRTRHEFITGMFGDGKDLDEGTIVRLEPEES